MARPLENREQPAAKMKRHCHHCGTRLRMSMMSCPYCRRSTMSWLHFTLMAAVGAVVMFGLFRVI